MPWMRHRSGAQHRRADGRRRIQRVPMDALLAGAATTGLTVLRLAWEARRHDLLSWPWTGWAAAARGSMAGVNPSLADCAGTNNNINFPGKEMGDKRYHAEGSPKLDRCVVHRHSADTRATAGSPLNPRSDRAEPAAIPIRAAKRAR
jgi:hypothetical protein